jgi:hypothetical protein
MAKNPKKSKEATAPENTPAAPNPESTNGSGPAQASKSAKEKKTPAKSAGRAKAAGHRVTTRKSAAPAKARGAQRASQPNAAEDRGVTDDEIRLRAYFISEWRTQNGIAGDSAHDWLEARRQLQQEAGERK